MPPTPHPTPTPQPVAPLLQSTLSLLIHHLLACLNLYPLTLFAPTQSAQATTRNIPTLHCIHPDVARYISKFLHDAIPVVFAVGSRKSDNSSILGTQLVLVVLGAERDDRPTLARYIFSVNKLLIHASTKKKQDWSASPEDIGQVETFVQECVFKMDTLEGFPSTPANDISWKLVLEVGGLRGEVEESYFDRDGNSSNLTEASGGEGEGGSTVKVGEVLKGTNMPQGLAEGIWTGDITPHPAAMDFHQQAVAQHDRTLKSVKLGKTNLFEVEMCEEK